MLSQRLLKRTQGQATSQVPARDAAGKHIHQRGQENKLLTQADGGDVAYSDLIGPHDLHLLDQVPIAWKPVLAVGPAMLLIRDLVSDTKLTHQPLDVFAVDLPALL